MPPALRTFGLSSTLALWPVVRLMTLSWNFAGKRPGDLRPLLHEVRVLEKHDAGSGGFVVLVRANAAVVHGELLKVREDREGEFGTPTDYENYR
jgi:hypothetical protein